MSLAGHRTALDPHLAVLNFSDTEITFVDGLGKGIGLLRNLTSLVLNLIGTEIISMDKVVRNGVIRGLISLVLNLSYAGTTSVTSFARASDC